MQCCNCQAVDNVVAGAGEVICAPCEDCCSTVDGKNLTTRRTLSCNMTLAEDRAVESSEAHCDIAQPRARLARVDARCSNSTVVNPNATRARTIDDEMCSSCDASGMSRSAREEFDCTNTRAGFAAASNASCSGPESATFLPLPILDELQLVVDARAQQDCPLESGDFASPEMAAAAPILAVLALTFVFVWKKSPDLLPS